MDAHAFKSTEVYGGNSFSISKIGDGWAVWRFVGDEFGREFPVEAIHLDAEGMDELRDYFASYYAEDRDESAAEREP